MSDDVSIKVTDNRMFDDRGELREEFQHLEDSEAASAPEAADEAPPRDEPAAQERAPSPEPGRGAASPSIERPGEPPSHEAEPQREAPEGYEPSSRGVQFLDLVAMVAEPIQLFLGDVPMPDGSRAEDLERARLYIDLLGILQEKTRGNLDAEENQLLDDLIYRFRLRYVEKKG